MKRRTFTATSLAALLASPTLKAGTLGPTPTISGYQVAELHNGEWSKSHGGVASPSEWVHEGTLFQVASCSKTVACLAVLTLVRDNRVQLDQPVNRYLKRWQLSGPRSQTVTLAELMSHSAGTTVSGFPGYGAQDEIPTLLEILNGKPPSNTGPVRTRPRVFNRFQYSGGGTTILQAMIEDATATPFADFAHEAVLRPIGSPHATFALRPGTDFAMGYRSNGKVLEGGFRRHPESAAAGLWATASDLVRVMQAILASLQDKPDGILPSSLARRMVTPIKGQAGLGVFARPGRQIWHDGRNEGFDSIMTVDLQTGVIQAGVTNKNGALDLTMRKWTPD